MQLTRDLFAIAKFLSMFEAVVMRDARVYAHHTVTYHFRLQTYIQSASLGLATSKFATEYISKQ